MPQILPDALPEREAICRRLCASALETPSAGLPMSDPPEGDAADVEH